MAPLRLLQQAGQGVDRCRGRPSTQHMETGRPSWPDLVEARSALPAASRRANPLDRPALHRVIAPDAGPRAAEAPATVSAPYLLALRAAPPGGRPHPLQLLKRGFADGDNALRCMWDRRGEGDRSIMW